MKRPKPVCPPKPSDLALRFSSLSIAIRGLSPTGSCSSLSSSTTSSESLSTLKLPQKRRQPLTPDWVKLSPGVDSQSAQGHTFYENPTQLQKINVLSRMKGQSGRRKDSTQSLYIDSPECDHLLPSSGHQQQTQNGQRRFSDPDLPYTDDNL